MKKLLIILALFASCKQVNKKENSSNEPTEIIFPRNQCFHRGHNYVLKASDNHDYLIVKYDLNDEQISHYIECRHCQNKKDLEKLKNTQNESFGLSESEQTSY
jgi:hypothetical protein